MTGPTPDPSGNIAPGLYHAEGDPPGTVRQWDGTQWVGGPVPAPPGATTAPLHSQDRFGSVGIRIGAALLDVVFTIAVAIAFILPLLALDVADSAGDATVGNNFSVPGVLVTLIGIGVNVWLIRQFGGTPGKLVLGLRITEADGVTTPPSLNSSAMRVIPIAIITNIPLLGFLAGIAVLVMSIIWVSNDAERRSVYDRVGNTRVVYKNRL